MIVDIICWHQVSICLEIYLTIVETRTPRRNIPLQKSITTLLPIDTFAYLCIFFNQVALHNKKAMKKVSIPRVKSSVLRQKGEPQNGCLKKKNHSKFSEIFFKLLYLESDFFICSLPYGSLFGPTWSLGSLLGLS